MDQVSLRATVRSDTGSRIARRMRRAGTVPGVLYGHGLDPVSVAVDRRELYAVLHTEAGLNALINLEVEGTKKPFLTVAREVQRHPVRGEISHLDFINIRLDEKIHAEVSLEFHGTPRSVKEEGAIVETIRTTVNISALPMDIPAHVPVDLSGLALGSAFKVEDLAAIDGVEYLDDPDTDLVSVVIPRVAAEGAEGAEGAEPALVGTADEDESGDED